MRSTSENNVYFTYIQTDNIKPGKFNPRKTFNPTDINELATSFKEYGVIQPITVYRKNSYFVIICGERRWKAAKKANLSKLPAIVHKLPPKNEVAISLALIENMHRKDVDVLSES